MEKTGPADQAGSSGLTQNSCGISPEALAKLNAAHTSVTFKHIRPNEKRTSSTGTALPEHSAHLARANLCGQQEPSPRTQHLPQISSCPPAAGAAFCPCGACSPADALKFMGSSCSDLAEGSTHRAWVGFVKYEFSCNHFHAASPPESFTQIPSDIWAISLGLLGGAL